MRASVLLLGAAIVLATTPAAASASASTTDGPSLQTFFRIRAANSPDRLPDGSVLVRDWPDGIWQLYRIRPNAAGSLIAKDAAREKLTDFPDGLSRYSLSPDGGRVALMHARGGDENTLITLIDLADPGRRTPVVEQARVQADVNVWLRDGSGFVYSANAASPADFHLYRYDLGSRKTTPVLTKEGSWRARDVTSDGKRMLVQRRLSASESRVYELELATGELREITIAPASGTASCEAVGYLPGEKLALLTSDREKGSTRLYVRELASGKIRAALPALEGHEIDGARINDRRDLLVVTTNEDGYSAMQAYALPALKPVPLAPVGRGVITLGSFRGSTLVYTLVTSQQPGEARALTFGNSGAAAAVRLTAAEDQGLDLASLPEPRLIRYRSFDGREIPALLTVPRGYTPGSPIPFVVNYHGGPEGQARPTFSATEQYLLSRGYGVMAPNVRGSTGYGREYQMLDDYRKRWDSVKDGVAAAAWLVANGYASPGKIATMGGSYGGFMSVACNVEDQEAVDRGERKERLFGACIDVVGIVNMKTFLEHTSGYRRKLREAEYGPLTDPAFLETISSLKRADKIQVPVFIGHGFNDPRVPVEEAMQLASELRSRGRTVRLFIAPDEGHGFQKLDNRIYFGERITAFLDETLKGVATPRARGLAAEE